VVSLHSKSNACKSSFFFLSPAVQASTDAPSRGGGGRDGVPCRVTRPRSAHAWSHWRYVCLLVCSTFYSEFLGAPLIRGLLMLGVTGGMCVSHILCIWVGGWVGWCTNGCVCVSVCVSVCLCVCTSHTNTHTYVTHTHTHTHQCRGRHRGDLGGSATGRRGRKV
jgi:hypothetical protein